MRCLFFSESVSGRSICRQAVSGLLSRSGAAEQQRSRSPFSRLPYEACLCNESESYSTGRRLPVSAILLLANAHSNGKARFSAAVAV